MAELKVVDTREVPGLAKLYLAEFPGPGFRLAEFVDTVEPGVHRDEKRVLMVSTQFGCPVGCGMCDAGAMGFHGNLTADQMMAQIRRAAAGWGGLPAWKHPKLKVHFARMGEPALNPAVLEALERIPAELGWPGFLPSISTVAPDTPQAEAFLERLPGIKDAHYRGGRFQLQFSLHSTSPEARARLIPAPVWGLGRVAAYGRRFVRPGDRKVTLNFALPRGERLGAEKLAALFDPACFLVKVTPVNPTAAAEGSGTAFVWNEAPALLKEDAAALEAAGFDVILSPSAPEEIAAETSCGQLWASAMKERAARRAPAALSRLPFSRERSALLLVDLQGFFLSTESPAFLPASRGALAGAERLARAFRRAGRPVLFTSHAHLDPASDGGLMTARWRKVCLSGGPHAGIWRSLAARDVEVFRKTRYSAFSNPELETRLRGLGVDSLVVAGLRTDLCVESTVRAAFDLGFSCVVAGDACASDTPARHRAALESVAHGFGAVRGSLEIAAWAAEAAPDQKKARDSESMTQRPGAMAPGTAA